MFFVVCFALCALAAWGCTVVRAAEPARVIFDSDMDGDCDDVAALALLHALADRGEAQILATIASGRSKSTPACMNAINTYYGRPDIPVGRAAPGGVDRPSSYTGVVADRCPHALHDPAKAEDAVTLYRRVLVASPDHSVVIATVGFHTNLAALLKSPADSSQPAGIDLVRQKVRLWTCMGGNFIGTPAHDDLKLGNVNFQKDAPATLYAITHWPGRIVFLGREVASVPSGVKVGAQFNQLPADHPVRIAYEAYFKGHCKDRHVADPATVLFAVRGAGDLWTLHDTGHMDLQPDMKFTWSETPGGDQAYVLKRTIDGKPNDHAVEKTIEDLILTPPTARAKQLKENRHAH
jgi:inosine-uridine nucleoside N-ribohydrolase